MLKTYYDMRYRDQFAHYFKGTYIYDHVTPNQGQYLVIHLDFSKVTSDFATLEKDFNDLVGRNILTQATLYQDLFPEDFIPELKRIDTAKNRLDFLCTQAQSRELQTYLLVDEYDSFTNAVLAAYGQKNYQEITHGTGSYRDFFKVAKTGFSRIFITGVSPVTLDDLTSGFNIATNLSLNPAFNDMMGFTTPEVKKIIGYYQENGYLTDRPADEIIAEISPRHDNYCFSPEAFQQSAHVYNSYMVTTYLSSYAETGRPPAESCTDNILIDYGKLMQIIFLSESQSPDDFDTRQEAIINLTNGMKYCTAVSAKFPAEKLTEFSNFISYLFYLGMLTVTGTEMGLPLLGIPNSGVRSQYLNYVWNFCAEKFDHKEIISASNLIADAARSGNIQPFVESMISLCSRNSSKCQLKIREGLFQAWFLAFLSWNRIYEPSPESELRQGYSDILLFPRHRAPDIAHSYILELKYLNTGAGAADMDKARAAAADQLACYRQDPRIRLLARAPGCTLSSSLSAALIWCFLRRSPADLEGAEKQICPRGSQSSVLLRLAASSTGHQG